MNSSLGMKKSSSVPGLMSLGTHLPKLGSHAKLATLAYAGNHGPMDAQRLSTPPNEKAASVADLLKKPAWRWTSVPQLPREQPDEGHKNMKWPRNAPAWLKHDKHVLRFYGFFQETVVERWDENCRYRHVVFCYYMEDGTMSITEPKVENSGMPQGPFLKRQRVMHPSGMGYMDPSHFRIGEELHLYGVTYHVTGADRFTRWFYEENGLELGEDEPLMQDQWQKSYTFTKIAEKGGLPLSRSAVEAKHLTAFQLGKPPQGRKLVQFLQNDRKVLRFKAYWDDPTLYGNRIYFTIHYYLADNTCEINEAHARNSGRDSYPVFYRRSPLYKENRINAYPGMLEPEKAIYEPVDLMVGESIEVWRRTIVIYDCDDFTTNFYKEYLGVDQKVNILDVSEKPRTHAKLAPPVHNGIGYPEDALQNVLMIQPKPPTKDLARLMTLSGELLRFEARMVNGEAEDENRRFIVGYFPADNQVGCWELNVRNSGHMGGKFAEKKRMVNPDSGEYFAITDFGVGKTVTIAAQPLLMLRADEHTLAYLENNADEFPSADPRYCADLLRPLAGLPQMREEGGVDPDDLKALAEDHGIGIVDHEIITLLRHFNASGDGAPPMISGPAAMRAIGAA